MSSRLAVLVSLVALACACSTGVVFPPDGGTWAPAPVPSWAARERIAVTDNGDDTLSFVSLDLPPSLLGKLAIGDNPIELEGPHHIARSPDGQFLYVGLSNYVPGSGSGPHGAHGLGTVPGSLLKLSATNAVKVGEAVVDRNPGDVIVNHDGSTAFVSHYDLLKLQAQVQKGLPEADGYSTIAVVDTATMARPALYPVCPAMHGMALSRDEKTLYVVCGQTDQLAVFDLTTHTVTSRVFVGPGPGAPLNPAYFPYTVTRSPVDDTLWISCNKSGDVRVYDPRLDGGQGGMDASKTVFVNGVAMFSTFLSDGKTLLVPHQGDDRLSYIDTTSATETAVVALPPQACLNAHAVMVTPDDKTAYVVCEGDHVTRPGSVVAVDVAAQAVVGYANVGMFPDGEVLLPPAM